MSKVKKWIIISVVVLFALGVGLVSVYLNATKPLRVAEDKSVELVKEKLDLSNFSDFNVYNGESTYYVMTAENQNEEQVYVWISENGNEIITKQMDSGLNKEEAVNTVYANRAPNEIISVRLGITQIQQTKRPAWEIYYRTENGLLNYYYVDFETGEKLRAIDNF